jgi:uncharacterized membrane protein YccC
MAESWEWLSSGAGTILLALLAGAGGSVLLELLWRPRRDRRRAAGLLAAEVALNTELLLLQAHARQADRFGIPADLRMSVMGWHAVAELVSELPFAETRELIHIYNQYDALNRQVAAYGVALAEHKAAAAGSSEYRDSETMVLRILDVFNTGLDATLANGQALIPGLAKLAGVKETAEEKARIPNYSEVAAEHMAMRKAHLEALRAEKRGGE